jgi:hypothetical protein
MQVAAGLLLMSRCSGAQAGEGPATAIGVSQRSSGPTKPVQRSRVAALQASDVVVFRQRKYHLSGSVRAVQLATSSSNFY